MAMIDKQDDRPGTKAEMLTSKIFAEIAGIIAKNAPDKSVIDAQERVQTLIYREMKGK